MILLFLTTTALAADLAELPPQPLGEGECATFLWTKSDPPRRIAMLKESGSTLVIRKGKETRTLRQTGPYTFRDGGETFVFDLEMTESPSLTNGRLVRHGALRIERADGSSVVLSVGGLEGCR